LKNEDNYESLNFTTFIPFTWKVGEYW